MPIRFANTHLLEDSESPETDMDMAWLVAAAKQRRISCGKFMISLLVCVGGVPWLGRSDFNA
jgi:hypothetical protein